MTGGAQRIGRQIVLALARLGFDVAIHCHRSVAQAEATANEARALGVQAWVFEADLLDHGSVETLIPRINETAGLLSVLVNNASVFEEDSIHTATRESWDRHLDSNLRAPFTLIQHFAAQHSAYSSLRRSDLWALPLVVNIIDQRVMKPRPDYLTYSLAKAGLWWLTRTSAQALAPDIRVNAIAPGPTLKGARQAEADFDRQSQAILLQRGPDPEEISDAVSYLLRARSVTGQMICVDGGQHLAWQTPDAVVPE